MSGGAMTDRIPILRMGQFLLVTIQVDMHDRLALALQDDLTQKVVETHAHGVLIDISSLDVVDSFIGRTLANIASMARILDAETVVVGMQPAVAITLVELGLSLPGVRTALNVERGMAMLQRSARARGALIEVAPERHDTALGSSTLTARSSEAADDDDASA
jgi:rsbT antagonist protein RsbS